MTEYLDREKTLEEIIKALGIKSKDNLLPAERKIYDIVEQASVADVRPVKMAESPDKRRNKNPNKGGNPPPPDVPNKGNNAHGANDLISRAELLEALKITREQLEKTRLVDIDTIIYMVTDMDSEKLARKTGTWIDVNGDGSLFRCDQCFETVCCRGNKFCPDCGARMEVEG